MEVVPRPCSPSPLLSLSFLAILNSCRNESLEMIRRNEVMEIFLINRKTWKFSPLHFSIDNNQGQALYRPEYTLTKHGNYTTGFVLKEVTSGRLVGQASKVKPTKPDHQVQTSTGFSFRLYKHGFSRAIDLPGFTIQGDLWILNFRLIQNADDQVLADIGHSLQFIKDSIQVSLYNQACWDFVLTLVADVLYFNADGYLKPDLNNSNSY